MNHGKMLSAYSAFHLPLHLPEIFWILSQNTARLKKMPAPKRVLDYGCGPGTASISLLLSQIANQKKIQTEDLHLLDLSGKAIDMAERLIRTLPGGDKIKIKQDRFARLPGRRSADPYDWIIMSHVLNEFGNGPVFRDKKLAWLGKIVWAYAKPGSVIVLVEPQLREPTMDLMWLRDEIIENEEIAQHLQIVAPCPQGTKRCPMLLTKMGWCYAQPWRKDFVAAGLAPWDNMIEIALDIDLDHPGFSYLVLQVKDEKTPELWGDHKIAVTDDTRTNGLWCSPGGKITTRKTNAPFRGAYHLPPK